jgi:four helix bundle protein
MRRSSRSVCTNIGEAWRKRRYPAHFVSKMSDSEGEAEETRVWVEIAARCKYLTKADASDLDLMYDQILAQLVVMIDNKAAIPESPHPRIPASPRLRVSASPCPRVSAS